MTFYPTVSPSKYIPPQGTHTAWRAQATHCGQGTTLKLELILQASQIQTPRKCHGNTDHIHIRVLAWEAGFRGRDALEFLPLSSFRLASPLRLTWERGPDGNRQANYYIPHGGDQCVLNTFLYQCTFSSPARHAHTPISPVVFAFWAIQLFIPRP